MNEAALCRLGEHFCSAERKDDLLGRVFNELVADWPDHFEKLIAFWSSITIGGRRHAGSPMGAHLVNQARIWPEMFDRGLYLWSESTKDLMSTFHRSDASGQSGGRGKPEARSVF